MVIAGKLKPEKFISWYFGCNEEEAAEYMPDAQPDNMFGTEMYAEDMGAEYYETTAHPGARPDHVVWQGQVFKIIGEAGGYRNFYESTGYGTVTGLCGANCRHSFHPFWPGISKPAYTQDMLGDYTVAKYKYGDRNLTEYECSQIQRRMERAIRGSKRILAGYDSAIIYATDEETERYFRQEFQVESVKLKQRERKLKGRNCTYVFELNIKKGQQKIK